MRMITHSIAFVKKRPFIAVFHFALVFAVLMLDRLVSLTDIVSGLIKLSDTSLLDSVVALAQLITAPGTIWLVILGILLASLLIAMLSSLFFSGVFGAFATGMQYAGDFPADPETGFFGGYKKRFMQSIALYFVGISALLFLLFVWVVSTIPLAIITRAVDIGVLSPILLYCVIAATVFVVYLGFMLLRIYFFSCLAAFYSDSVKPVRDGVVNAGRNFFALARYIFVADIIQILGTIVYGLIKQNLLYFIAYGVITASLTLFILIICFYAFETFYPAQDGDDGEGDEDEDSTGDEDDAVGEDEEVDEEEDDGDYEDEDSGDDEGEYGSDGEYGAPDGGEHGDPDGVEYADEYGDEYDVRSDGKHDDAYRKQGLNVDGSANGTVNKSRQHGQGRRASKVADSVLVELLELSAELTKSTELTKAEMQELSVALEDSAGSTVSSGATKSGAFVPAEPAPGLPVRTRNSDEAPERGASKRGAQEYSEQEYGAPAYRTPEREASLHGAPVSEGLRHGKTANGRYEPTVEESVGGEATGGAVSNRDHKTMPGRTPQGNVAAEKPIKSKVSRRGFGDDDDDEVYNQPPRQPRQPSQYSQYSQPRQPNQPNHSRQPNHLSQQRRPRRNAEEELRANVEESVLDLSDREIEDLLFECGVKVKRRTPRERLMLHVIAAVKDGKLEIEDVEL